MASSKPRDVEVPLLGRRPATDRCSRVSGDGLDREVPHERRRRRAGRRQVLPQLLDQLAVARVPGSTSEPDAARRAPRSSSTGLRGHLLARAPRTATPYIDDLAHSPPRSYSVPSTSVTVRRAVRRDARRPGPAPGQLGHRVVVAVGLVGLEHRELGLCVESAPSLRKFRLISKTLLDAADDARLRNSSGAIRR